MSGYTQARDIKAAALEQFIVEAGKHHAFIDSNGADAEIRRDALARLSRERGKSVDASKDTWDRVLFFLRDRFGAKQ